VSTTLTDSLAALEDATEPEEQNQMHQVIEQPSARHQTVRFEHPQWEKHPRQYEDRTRLVAAVRVPGVDRSDTRLVLLSVNRIVERVMSKLDTLPVDTLRLLEESKSEQAGVRPLARIQNARS